MTSSAFLEPDINLDCKCGMGVKCLLVRRKHEKARRIQSQVLKHSSFRSAFHLKEPIKMSKWNNIADLTRHRETIKVFQFKFPPKLAFLKIFI